MLPAHHHKGQKKEVLLWRLHNSFTATNKPLVPCGPTYCLIYTHEVVTATSPTAFHRLVVLKMVTNTKRILQTRNECESQEMFEGLGSRHSVLGFVVLQLQTELSLIQMLLSRAKKLKPTKSSGKICMYHQLSKSVILRLPQIHLSVSHYSRSKQIISLNIIKKWSL
jgi:hypothetical protein